MGRKHVISVEEADDSMIGYFYASSIGSIVVLILIISLFVHILYHYLKIFHSKQSNKDETRADHNKLIYILFLLLLTSTMIMCVVDGFVRSNYWSNIPLSDYGKAICYASYYADITMLQFHQFIMYALFIYRIQIVFQDTVYEYSLNTFRALYSLLIFGYLAVATIVFVGHKYSSFTVYYFAQNAYCSASPETKQNVFTVVSSSIYSLWHIGLNVICLYMLTNRLWALKETLIEQYTVKNSVQSQSNIEVISPSDKTLDISNTDKNVDDDVINRTTTDSIENKAVSSPNHLSVATADNIIVSNKHSKHKHVVSQSMSIQEIIVEQKKGDKEASRIIALHKLILKLCILVLLSIFSWLLYPILLRTVSLWWWGQKIWFLAFNDILVWFMFGETEKYWQFILKFVCCYCCIMR